MILLLLFINSRASYNLGYDVLCSIILSIINIRYTGWLVTGGTSGKGVILRENKASNEKFVFYIFDFFFRVESPPLRLYHQLSNTLYNFHELRIRYMKLLPAILLLMKQFQMIKVLGNPISSCRFSSGYIC